MYILSTGIFAPVHKISKANVTSSPAVVRKSVRQISEVKKDSPTNTLERSKSTLTDVQVSIHHVTMIDYEFAL